MEDAKAETQRALEKTTRELERALKELARSKELHVKTKGDLKTCQTLRGEEADPNLVVLAINRCVDSPRLSDIAATLRKSTRHDPSWPALTHP